MFVPLLVAMILVGAIPSAMLNSAPKFLPHFKLNSTTDSGSYWFQVGAWASSDGGYGDEFGQSITGASVEIRILDQKLNHADTQDDYWVGVNLPNDAFVQAGYMTFPQYNSGHPSLFWEYFLPGTANENSGGFLGNEGETAGSNGTWVKFTVMSNGTIWSAYANDHQLGHIDLSISNSGTSGPYAVAESAQTYWTDNIMGPVEFRNLSYRDQAGAWHQASAAVSLCCYGVTSATYGAAYPYGVESIPGENNHWVAGSGLPYAADGGEYLWPWYYVTVRSPVGSATGSGWYTEESEITPQADQRIPINDTARYSLEGWTDGTYTANGFVADSNMTISAVYVKQYLVTVTSPLGTVIGSGWYDAGSTAKIKLTPTSIPANGILGLLGVSNVATGWGGDYTGGMSSDGSATLNVNSPLNIHVIWTLNLGLILPAIAGVATLAIVSVAVAYRRRSKIEYCLNCGHKLPKGSIFCLDCGHKQTS
jgi:hypothetical protein